LLCLVMMLEYKIKKSFFAIAFFTKKAKEN